MSTVIATSSAGLESALRAAQAGDTILLAAGSYSNVTIQDFHTSGTVTISSADPTNKAVLSDLNVLSSSGLTFSGLEFSSAASQFSGLSSAILADPYPFRVTNSDRITFTGDDFHGSLDSNPANDRGGLLISNSTHVTVTNSEFHELSHGIVHSLSQYVTFSGNTMHDIRSDGIIGSSSDATITYNMFSDFYPVDGDHPDAIQFLDQEGLAPHDLIIEGNAYVRGAGAAVEGVFMRIADDSPLKFVNVTISDNFFEGSTYHGITVLGAENLTVSDNALYGLADYTSRIWIGNSVNVLETNNKASAFIYGSNDSASWTPTNSNSNIITAGEVLTSTVTSGSGLFEQWVADHPAFTSSGFGGIAWTGGAPAEVAVTPAEFAPVAVDEQPASAEFAPTVVGVQPATTVEFAPVVVDEQPAATAEEPAPVQPNSQLVDSLASADDSGVLEHSPQSLADHFGSQFVCRSLLWGQFGGDGAAHFLDLLGHSSMEIEFFR